MKYNYVICINNEGWIGGINVQVNKYYKVGKMYKIEGYNVYYNPISCWGFAAPHRATAFKPITEFELGAVLYGWIYSLCNMYKQFRLCTWDYRQNVWVLHNR